MKSLQQIWRGFVFLLIYLLIVIYTLAFPSDTAWTLFIFATLFSLLELFSFIGSLKKLRIHAQTDLLVHINEPVSVQIQMEKSPKTILLLANLSLSAPQYRGSFSYLFYHGQKKQLQVTWHPTARGPVKKQRLYMVASDLFGWFKKETKNEFAVDWYVLPLIHPLGQSAARFFKKDLLISRQNFGEPTFDIKKFRPYQPGDRLAQIDWKISSKQQELVLREYEQEETTATIFLFYGSKSPYFEAMLSLFYTLWKDLQDENIQFVLIGEQIKNRMHLTQEDFSLIQPLTQDRVLPVFGKKQIILFVPEAKLQPTITSKQRGTQVYDYQQLEQQLKE